MKPRLILLTAIVASAFAPSHAQTLKDSVLINFRQSKSQLDTTYMDNPQALQHVRSMIKQYHHPDSNFVLTGVNVTGAASPEGSVKYNDWLSRQRANRLFSYIGEQVDLPDSLTTFSYLGRDWHTLRSMVEADTNVPYRNEVLAMLDEIIETHNNANPDHPGNLRRIKQLRGGVPYIYMYHHLFPAIRASKVVLTFGAPSYALKMPAVGAIFPMFEEKVAVSLPNMAFAPAKHRKPFYMALKTNMISDLLLIPEIGAEFYLGKNMSIVGNWMYGWWDVDRTHWYWRAYGGDLAVRWWFGKKAHEKPLTGHHVGVYGGAITYDFEFGGTGHMGGIPGGTLWDRCNWYAGLEYGYSLPIARRLNIDFTIGLGCLSGKYVIYDPVDKCYVWRETRKRTWFGPTKVEASLVWLIGHGNYNKAKGGHK